MKVYGPIIRRAQLAFAAWLTALSGNAQTTVSNLPVFQIVQSGASAAQAGSLATYLGIPAGNLSVSNGLVCFNDPANYLAVPATPITDSILISNLLAVTKNPNPAIPISFQAIDFGALGAMPVFGTNSALSSASNALALSGLTPQNGARGVGHALFTAFYTNAGGTLISNSQFLDTSVVYQLATPNGYPLVGPGAQVQMTYGPTGNVTRLLYAARQLSEGPSVQLLAPTEASNRFARVLPAHAKMNLELVYWSPPFGAVRGGGSGWNPTTVIPWYACRSTIDFTNPVTAVVSPTRLRDRFIPATDDPQFVPALQLSVSATNMPVLGTVLITGGRPPFTCLWSSSDPATSTNTGVVLSFTPRVRIAPPPLQITPPSPSGAVTVSWPYPSAGFVLESASSVTPSAWTPVTLTVQTNSNQNQVSFDIGNLGVFFRLRLTNAPPRNEMLALTVTDANGISISTNRNFFVLPQPWAVYKPGIFELLPSYGCESPNDPGGFIDDRVGWQEAMSKPDAGGGIESFCWTGDSCWPGDFIKPSPPGKLPAQPWLNGDADFSNWGVNTANIVMIVADGNADSFTSMLPGSSVDSYWTSELYRPGNPEGTVWANNQFYQVNCTNSWGPLGPNDRLEWLCGLLCDVLDPINSGNQPVWERWGPAFNGLHSFTGFATEAHSGGALPKVFAEYILGIKDKWLAVPGTTNSIVQAWFIAGTTAANNSTPAAMGPVGPNAVSDYGDFYWYKGPVGPTIPPAQVKGWWYLQGQGPIQFSP